MDPFATSHFSHRALLLELKASVGNESRSTAVVLSRIAEFDRRQLFLPEGYPSMHAFCVRVLNYSDGAAFKRITAARVARRFPVVLVAVAEGRLHLSGVVMLSKYLTSGNLDELLAAATHKTKAEIEQLIADRFPRPDLPERMQPILPPPIPAMAPAQGGQLSPGTVQASVPWPGPPIPLPDGQLSPGTVEASMPWSGPPIPLPGGQLSPGTVGASVPWSGPPIPPPVGQLSPGTVHASAPARISPLGSQRFGLQCTVDLETNELWHYARALLSHEVPAGNIALVLKSVLKLAVGQLEKRKFAATSRPGHSSGASSLRHIPAAVKRAVLERDGDRCTFVGENGQRCSSRMFLEFDHAVPVARGGQATVENLRLLCRSHNQFEAARAFGAEFVARKLEERGVRRRE